MRKSENSLNSLPDRATPELYHLRKKAWKSQITLLCHEI
jgi:hypothetical protein